MEPGQPMLFAQTHLFRGSSLGFSGQPIQHDNVEWIIHGEKVEEGREGGRGCKEREIESSGGRGRGREREGEGGRERTPRAVASMSY